LATAAGSGYLASQATAAEQRYGLWMIGGVALLLAAVVWWLLPREVAGSTATWTYWAELSQISSQADAFDQRAGQPATPAAMVDLLRQAAKLYDQLGTDIAQLSTSHVDLEAVAFGADQLQVLRETAVVTRDIQSFIEHNTGNVSVLALVSVFAE